MAGEGHGKSCGAIIIAALLLWLPGCTPAPRPDDAQITRIVSTAPSLTEMVFALQADDRLVGVTSYCDFPPAAKRKPKIGDFAAPSMEAILQQEPDLVLLLGERPDLVAKIQGFALPHLILRQEDLPGIYRSVRRLATRLDKPARGDELVETIQTRIAAVEKRVSPLPKKRVLFVVGRSPGSLTDIYAAGRGSYLGQLVERAGGRNIFRDAPMAYPKISVEEILRRDPEVLIDMSHGQELESHEIEATRKMWSQFPTLQAVQKDRIEVLADDIFLVPGPRVAEAVEQLAELLHGKEAP